MHTFTQPEAKGQVKIGDIRLDTSTSARLVSWKKALEDFPKHPLLGHGITGYSFVDAQYPRVLVETGILGFMAFFPNKKCSDSQHHTYEHHIRPCMG